MRENNLAQTGQQAASAYATVTPLSTARLSVCLCLPAELLPATLSQLPGDHLTQLVLTADRPDMVCWDDMARLTSLQDLRMPMLNPPPAVLATVFTSLTRLTLLLMVEAPQSVSRSIPASLQELVLVQNEMQFHPVRLAHLTNLRAVMLGRYREVPDGWPREHHDSDSEDEEPIYVGGALASDAALPTCLRRLSVEHISFAPLANLQQLECIEVCDIPKESVDLGMAHEFDRLEFLPEIQRVCTQLTRLELTQHPGSLLLCFLDIPALHGRALEELGKRLHIHVPHLSLQVPRTACDDASINLAFSVLGQLTTLTSLQLNREWSQGCSHPHSCCSRWRQRRRAGRCMERHGRPAGGSTAQAHQLASAGAQFSGLAGGRWLSRYCTMWGRLPACAAGDWRTSQTAFTAARGHAPGCWQYGAAADWWPCSSTAPHLPQSEPLQA